MGTGVLRWTETVGHRLAVPGAVGVAGRKARLRRRRCDRQGTRRTSGPRAAAAWRQRRPPNVLTAGNGVGTRALRRPGRQLLRSRTGLPGTSPARFVAGLGPPVRATTAAGGRSGGRPLGANPFDDRLWSRVGDPRLTAAGRVAILGSATPPAARCATELSAMLGEELGHSLLCPPAVALSSHPFHRARRPLITSSLNPGIMRPASNRSTMRSGLRCPSGPTVAE